MNIKNLYAFFSVEEKVELMELIEKDYHILNELRAADPITGIPRNRIDDFIKNNTMSARLRNALGSAIKDYGYLYIEQLKEGNNFIRIRNTGKVSHAEFKSPLKI